MKAILSIITLLVICGGAAGAYFFLQKPAVASIDEEAIVEEVKEDTSLIEFVEMDPLILPIVNKKGVTHVVTLVVVLEVPDALAKDEVKKLKPRIKDAYISDLYGLLNDQALMKDGVLQVKEVKERLGGISKDLVGEDKVRDVLIQVVQQRPI